MFFFVATFQRFILDFLDNWMETLIHQDEMPQKVFVKPVCSAIMLESLVEAGRFQLQLLPN